MYFVKRIFLCTLVYCICLIILMMFLRFRNDTNYIKCLNYDENEFINDVQLHVETNFNMYLNSSFHQNQYEEHNEWSKISNDLYLYSAYTAACPFSLSSFCIQFVSVSLLNMQLDSAHTSDYRCAIKVKSKVIKLGFAVVEKLPEHHFKSYTASLLYCNLLNFSKNLSIIEYATVYKTSLNWKKVFINSNFTSNINLCIRPLYGSHSTMDFLAFVAYYSSMGVHHFTFYHFNVSKSTRTFLEFIKSTKLNIEVLIWDMPIDNDFIHEFGQVAFTQDCLIRSSYTFSHTIIVDVDEFLVTKLHSNLVDFVTYLDTMYSYAGSYTIPMAFFCYEFSYDVENTSVFRVLTYNKRQKTFWNHGIRSKYIAKSNRVHHGGVHFVWKHKQNWVEVKIPPSVALLHHYRRCCGVLQTWFFELLSFYVLNDVIAIDNSLINFAPSIMNQDFVAFVLNLANSTSN